MEILAGPAVRYTQADVVYIWMVLDERANDIVVLADENDALPDSNATASARGSVTQQQIISLAEHIHVLMVALKPTTATEFVKDTKLFYNVFIDNVSLDGFGLINGDNRIVYNTDTLPSFYIPTKHHHIAQGSCRKPHAVGEGGAAQFDHMLTLDGLLQNSLDNLFERPSMLCLTGDQIYADDVALPLLEGLKEKAKWLTGWVEQLPDPQQTGKTLIPDTIKLNARAKVLKKEYGFSSGKKNNHLMTFGEFMAMYLAVWGGLNIDMPEYSQLETTIMSRITNWFSTTFGSNGYQKQLDIVKTFLSNAKKTRRVMANISSYMIFDDHECSDDWNLSKENAEAFKNNNMSRRIQANALAAYWVCQGWGNKPPLFSDQFKQSLSEFFTSKTASNGDKFEQQLMNQNWGYTVEGYPVMVVLDTRMAREFPAGKPMQLMSDTKINSIGKEFERINDLYKESIQQQSLLLISAAPVLGFKAIEQLQLFAPKSINLVLQGMGLSAKRLLQMTKWLAVTADTEPWINNQHAYTLLLEQLKIINVPYCSIFSGDVHYAFVRRMTLLGSNKNNITVNQFVSSSLHNAPNGVNRFILKELSNSVFDRKKTGYVYPDNQANEFLSGYTNIAILELKQGVSIKNTFIFYNAKSAKEFRWRYLLDK